MKRKQIALVTGLGFANLCCMNKEIETFFHNIDEIIESDYGDYVRQANFHLNNLKYEMKRLPYLDVLNQIVLAQNHLLYQSTGKIRQTHARLIRDIKVASQLHDAHQQDWESKPDLFFTP